MKDNKTFNWLAGLMNQFDAKGPAGEDFYYLLDTMLKENRISFLDMLSFAAQGHGVRVHEGLEYILEQDTDDPSFFEGVIFVIGEYESSILEIQDYVSLLELVCKTYVTHFPDDASRVLVNLERVVSRYTNTNNGFR